MGRQRLIIAGILALTIAAVVVIIQIPTRLGLDLRGGSQLTLQVQPTEDAQNITPRDLEAIQRVIENRVNGLGVSEAVVQSVGSDQLSVQLPGVSDPEQAERVLGGTAQLEFLTQRPGTESQIRIEQDVLREHLIEQIQLEQSGDEAAIDANQANIEASYQAIMALFDPSGLTGDMLTDALARPLGAGSSWEVEINFNNTGADLFYWTDSRGSWNGTDPLVFSWTIS